MKTVDRTVMEEVGQHSTFPLLLRHAIVQSIAMINAVNENFDDLIAKNLAMLLPSADVEPQSLVSKNTLFKNDIEVLTPNGCVSIEVEKGARGRFELDREKIRAFAHLHRPEPCFGAMVVPANNQLARDITGAADESSYRYVLRSGRLFAESEHNNLDDILVVGYLVEPEGLIDPPHEARTRDRRGKQGTLGNIVVMLPSDEGEHIERFAAELQKRGQDSYAAVVRQSETLRAIHDGLHSYIPSLQEKWNTGIKYIGFASASGSAVRLYVYVQQHRLVLDVGLPRQREADLRSLGFEVHYRITFKAKRAG